MKTNNTPIESHPTEQNTLHRKSNRITAFFLRTVEEVGAWMLAAGFVFSIIWIARFLINPQSL